jgi:hypothetical protein
MQQRSGKIPFGKIEAWCYGARRKTLGERAINFNQNAWPKTLTFKTH